MKLLKISALKYVKDNDTGKEYIVFQYWYGGSNYGPEFIEKSRGFRFVKDLPSKRFSIHPRTVYKVA